MSMKAEEQPVIPTETSDLISCVSKLHSEGYRLDAISITKNGEIFQVDYPFDLNFSFRTVIKYPFSGNTDRKEDDA